MEVVTPFSQLKDGSQGMENLEESQDKPPQARGNSSPGPFGAGFACHVVLDTK